VRGCFEKVFSRRDPLTPHRLLDDHLALSRKGRGRDNARLACGDIKERFPRAILPILFFVVASVTSAASHARAEPVEDFYKGKELQVLVGNPAGGGYDIYARFLARHLSRFIPGHPAVVVVNMPGANGMIMTNHLFNRAARDGTVIGMPNRSDPTEPLFGNSQARYDPRRFNWIGSMNNEVSVCGSWHTARVARFEDLKAKELIVGSTGPGDDTYIFPLIVNNVLGTKMRIVSGYPGGNDLNVALERGEIEGRCGMSYSSLVGTRPEWLRENRFRILLQISAAKHPDLAEVPLVLDLAQTERQRQVMKMLFARQLWGRPFVTPPQVPEARVEALRRGFDEAMNDASFRDEANRAKLEITPVRGEIIEKEIADIYATPAEVVAAAVQATKPQ
jgi:tripartite-type tricarboxylate transporter receptor subunit TctC